MSGQYFALRKIRVLLLKIFGRNLFYSKKSQLCLVFRNASHHLQYKSLIFHCTRLIYLGSKLFYPRALHTKYLWLYPCYYHLMPTSHLSITPYPFAYLYHYPLLKPDKQLYFTAIIQVIFVSLLSHIDTMVYSPLSSHLYYKYQDSHSTIIIEFLLPLQASLITSSTLSCHIEHFLTLPYSHYLKHHQNST